MKAAVTKHTPKPSEKAAEMRRRAVAHEHADTAFERFLDGLPRDDGIAIEAARRLTRLATALIATRAGVGEMHGVLAGSAAVAAPAYRSGPKLIEAEALFRKGER